MRNAGSGSYELTIINEAQEAAWLIAGTCENFAFDGGDGSTSDPYQISNICQLQNIAADDLTADGESYTNLLAVDKSYKLTQNIEANYTSNWDSEKGFNPIGDDINNFDGIFDGGGFTLSNLTINRPDTYYIGLFGYNEGTLKDITLDIVDITGSQYTGGLVGQNDGTINNSIVDGNIMGLNFIAGIVGINNGTITDSTFDGSVVGNDYIGGFVGYNSQGTIKNSASSGSVDGNNNVGGFVGYNLVGTYADDKWCRQTDNSGLSAVGFPSDLIK